MASAGGALSVYLRTMVWAKKMNPNQVYQRLIQRVLGDLLSFIVPDHQIMWRFLDSHRVWLGPFAKHVRSASSLVWKLQVLCKHWTKVDLSGTVFL